MKKTIKTKIIAMRNNGMNKTSIIEVDKALPIFDMFKSGINNIIIEIGEPILDETEKRYLSAVIKPFRNKIEYIKKIDSGSDGCYIEITMKDNDSLIFPYFKDKRMYKGMESFEAYTLEELGL